MKPFFFIISLLITASILGCAKESDDKTYPGYIKPGDFRPRGVLASKEISLGGSLSGYNCAGSDCLAVYANWPVGTIVLKGIAVKDNSTDPTFSMYIIQTLGGWHIQITNNGIDYSQNVLAEDISISSCTSTVQTLPPCAAPPCAEEFDASGVYLVETTVDFINTITIGPLTINSGSRIVAQGHGVIAPDC